MSVRGQEALEFMVLSAYMLVVFACVAYFVTSHSMVLNQQARNNDLAASAQSFNREVLLAVAVADHYERHFELPQTVGGAAYTLRVAGTSEVTLHVTTSGEEYVIFLPVNVTFLDTSGEPLSEFRPGTLTIIKTNENITIIAGA